MSNQNVNAAIKQVFSEIAAGLESGSFGKRARVGLTLPGSELGEAELLRGAELAQSRDPAIEVVAIGKKAETTVTLVEADGAEDAHKKMDEMLESGELDAAVTLHYSFPIGVSTVPTPQPFILTGALPIHSTE